MNNIFDSILRNLIMIIDAETNLSTITEDDLNSIYEWKVSGEENCPSCKNFDGKAYKLKEWVNIAIPGHPNNESVAGMITNYPHSPYGTFCEENCKCSLLKKSISFKPIWKKNKK